MKLSRRTAATATALAALSLVGTAVATAPASAAAEPGAYNGACGTGYRVQNVLDVKSSQTNVIGVLYVTYSRTDHKHCAVLVRTKPGTRLFMEVTLDTAPSSGAPAKDYGSFKEYAGPVYVDSVTANDPCLEWSGSIDIYYNSEIGYCA
ncbi:hypothetical protein OG241_24030 [Streptomyces sp. NBC_01390]|uniref:hypothetical protein n=1 Tax=Streptomyces sp. NBC_01390 TaxID=2903850 RepID=UPI003244C1C3